MTAEIQEPGLRIIDAHHHLWDFGPILSVLPDSEHPLLNLLRSRPRYLFDDLLKDVQSGHNIVGSVFVECQAFYRADGPPELKPVGEVEFANGAAAQSASGLYGPSRLCAGIVGHVDLTRGDAAAAGLEAALEAGNGRLRGIRHIGPNDPDPNVLGPFANASAGLFADTNFRRGYSHLARCGLSFDAWVIEPQIGEVSALADAFPDTKIVLDHVGTPLGIGSYAGRLDERFPIWRDAIRDLARRDNAFVKLSGLAMPYCGMPGVGPGKDLDFKRAAELWRPYLETCIEAFGPSRAMFASNFPTESWGITYDNLWNAFKAFARGASIDEKHELFSNSAARFYRLDQFL